MSSAPTRPPALMIANGAPCSNARLRALLKYKPYILALDGAADRLHAAGININAAIGDFDSINNIHNIINHQPDITIINAPSQQKTDFEKGLDYLIKNNHTAVNILWATGYRTDHTYANLSNAAKYKNKITINIIDDCGNIIILPPNFTKYYAAHTLLSLMPIGTVRGITTHNLLYPLSNETLRIGGRIGTSNQVIADGTVKITHKNGNLMLMEVF